MKLYRYHKEYDIRQYQPSQVTWLSFEMKNLLKCAATPINGWIKTNINNNRNKYSIIKEEVSEHRYSWKDPNILDNTMTDSPQITSNKA